MRRERSAARNLIRAGVPEDVNHEALRLVDALDAQALQHH